MRVFLTGATGFLGKNVARLLHGRGHELRALARPGSNVRGLPAGTELSPGDVTDAASLEAGAAGCDAILHMAAMVKMWTPDRRVFDDVNVGGIRNVLAAARGAGARTVVTSSFMAIGPTGEAPVEESRLHPGGYCNDYERTKALADAVAREAIQAGQDVVLLYPGVVYGPGDLTDGNLVVKMVADHLAGRFPAIVGPGDRIWSYSFVEDVAAGHVAALERGQAGRRYFLCGDNVTMNGFFQVLQQVSGRRPPRLHLPYALASLTGRAMWAWAELTGQPPQLTHQVVDVFRKHWSYSSARAESELDYRCRPLEDGLRETVAWLRAREV